MLLNIKGMKRICSSLLLASYTTTPRATHLAITFEEVINFIKVLCYPLEFPKQNYAEIIKG